jgi:integrase
MGHKTIAMTARYAHLSPEHLKTALTKLDPKKIT